MQWCAGLVPDVSWSAARAATRKAKPFRGANTVRKVSAMCTSAFPHPRCNERPPICSKSSVPIGQHLTHQIAKPRNQNHMLPERLEADSQPCPMVGRYAPLPEQSIEVVMKSNLCEPFPMWNRATQYTCCGPRLRSSAYHAGASQRRAERRHHHVEIRSF